MNIGGNRLLIGANRPGPKRLVTLELSRCSLGSSRNGPCGGGRFLVEPKEGLPRRLITILLRKIIADLRVFRLEYQIVLGLLWTICTGLILVDSRSINFDQV